MKTFKKALSLTLAGVLASLTLTGCGGTAKNQTIITFYAGVSAEDGAAYKTMVETYNNGQGKTDGVYVDYKPKATGYDSDLSTVFEGKKVPDVITLSDQYFKGYTKDGKLYNIQSLKLNEARRKTVTLAEKKGWTVIGESFDNAGLSITASGFKEMQRAIRQGRVDNVIVASLNGVSTGTNAYQRFEQAILKRKVKLYDADDNLIIG